MAADEIVEIDAKGGRFDFYDILEQLRIKNRISEDTFNKTFKELDNIEKKGIDPSEMMIQQNKIFNKNLSNEGIKVLKYLNEFDASPTFRELNNVKTEKEFNDLINNYKIKPDISYMVLDKNIIKKTETENLGALPSLQNVSPITQEIIFLDTPNTVKNVFLKDTDRAKEIGGQIKNQDFRAPKLKTSTNEYAEPISLDELNRVKKEIYDMTQLRYKDLPEEITVYRVGKLNEEDGVSSFSLNPNYNVELNLPWQKGRDDPLVAYKVKKSDILASPDFAEGVGRGRAFDEDEVIIDNNLVTNLEIIQ